MSELSILSEDIPPSTVDRVVLNERHKSTDAHFYSRAFQSLRRIYRTIIDEGYPAHGAGSPNVIRAKIRAHNLGVVIVRRASQAMQESKD